MANDYTFSLPKHALAMREAIALKVNAASVPGVTAIIAEPSDSHIVYVQGDRPARNEILTRVARLPCERTGERRARALDAMRGRRGGDSA